MSKKTVKPKQNNYHRPNFWGMLRDVMIASLNKGQFPLAVLGLIVVILIAKMPSEDASKLIFELLELVRKFQILGWLISVFSLIGWFYNTKHLRKIHSVEMSRVSMEKKELQQKLLDKKLQTSN